MRFVMKSRRECEVERNGGVVAGAQSRERETGPRGEASESTEFVHGEDGA